MTLEEIREALRRLPPDQLKELLKEFAVAGDNEVDKAAKQIIDQYRPALKRLADR